MCKMHPSPRDFYLIFMVFILLFEVEGGWFQSKKNQPHIIVIIADDLGWNDVGFHGSDQVPTPNIDALAYNGVILNRFYVLPTCSPSRASFLTGRHAIRLGMQGLPILAAEPRGVPLKETLLPEHLKKLGYATRLLGKWHVGHYTERHTPTFRGFDSFTGYYNGYVKYFNHSITKDRHTGHDLHKNEGRKLEAFRSERYLTDLISDEAELAIRNHDKSRPLYLQLSHLAGHASEGRDFLEVRDLTELNETLGHIPGMYRRRYAGIIKAMDESVGRVVNALKVTGMLQNSVVVFFSDNGSPSNDSPYPNFGSNYPFRGAKASNFEGAVRVPALVFSPLIRKRSRVSDELVHVTDWLPTLVKLAGGGDLDDLDGVDQWPMISGAEKSKRDSLLVNIDEFFGLEAAVKGRFKLVKGEYLAGGYYGESGRGYSNYHYEAVRSSAAGKAVRGLFYWTPRDQKIRDLRAKATVTCSRKNDALDCRGGCLFDLEADPCETKDVSRDNPQVLQGLKDFVDEYRGQLVNQTNTFSDPAAYPENFGGCWQPWLGDEYAPPADRNLSLILSSDSFCEGYLIDDPRNCLH